MDTQRAALFHQPLATPEELFPLLTLPERQALFGVLVAQLEDIHAPMWSLEEEALDAGEELLAGLDSSHGERPLTPLEKGLAGCLCVMVHDLDHPTLSEEQNALLEALLELLIPEFGPIHAS